MGMKPRKAREPRGYTVAATVLDYCRTHETFTHGEIDRAVCRQIATAQGGVLRALANLRRRGLVTYEYDKSSKQFTVSAVREAGK